MPGQRIACVDIPALPLQILLRSYPQWLDLPVAVVQNDRPQGIILWVNAHARTHRILPGMTFAAGQALSAQLRAAEVSNEMVSHTVTELHEQLSDFSPRVEVHRDPGVFWVDPNGLDSLYGNLEQWASMICETLAHRGFQSHTVVGFHRYLTYALARAGPRSSAKHSSWVSPNPHLESRIAARVPLSHLALSPSLRNQLYLLGIETLGQFLRLSASELHARFGDEAIRLHRQASDHWTPLQPRPLIQAISGSIQLDHPDETHTRLLFALKSKLHQLLKHLSERGEALSSIKLILHLDHEQPHSEQLEPAQPTLDSMIILDLLRLRLESLVLPAPVESATLELEGIRATHDQLVLFRTQQRRDLKSANLALARVRARFGPLTVTRAKLRAAHLPEAAFVWEPISTIRFPTRLPADHQPPPLCRRLFSNVFPLPPRPNKRHRWRLGTRGAVTHLHGPYRVNGGWWVRVVERDYYFAELENGDVVWIYYDKPRDRWFLHGVID